MENYNPKIKLRFISNLWQFCDKKSSEKRLKLILENKTDPDNLTEKFFSLFSKIYSEIENSETISIQFIDKIIFILTKNNINKDDSESILKIMDFINNSKNLEFSECGYEIFKSCLSIESFYDFKIEMAKFLINFNRISNEKYPIIMYPTVCKVIADNINNKPFVIECFDNLFNRTESMNDRNNKVLTYDNVYSILLDNKETLTNSFGVKHLSIFGSYARNEQTKYSDLDLLVELNSNDFKKKEFIKFIKEKTSLPNDVTLIKSHQYLMKDVLNDAKEVF